ncbi:MAG: DNA methyltransferase [Rhodobacteraceae bacterium]|nr:DNA methyltransferase [Paracoccaceae bacterium]
MAQSYKNVYFRDCPKSASGRSSLTLAFGKRDENVFNAVRHLSSDSLRNALGYESFVTLQEHAQAEDKTLNAFCLSILRGHLETNGQSAAAWLPGFEAPNPIAFDPIQATFCGGRHEPLHGWYPWLEGYSPAFVESVIGRYCPNARSVFDPFGGTGTTALTACRLGKRAYYAEINPLLQFLTASKVIALRLRDRSRTELADELAGLGETLNERIDATQQDFRLKQTYNAVFGDSTFFDKEVFADVLRCRTLIDDIGCTAPLSARFLTIAVLRALIPASRLIRRGDLRFKTEQELVGDRIELRTEIRAALTVMARDIEDLSLIDHTPVLLLENAKNLDRIPALSVDTVITSPPYLNGTNYFRNTKVELWFLRCLKEREDLSRFRFGSMTVGINDVTVGKPVGEMPPAAAPVVEALEAHAYDMRIPRMVSCFASEMHMILHALAVHTRKGGTIVIDIGDSAYAGVHVPTDQFIAQSLDAAGFDLTNEITLRQRYSRSQAKLTQKLLVFAPKPGKRTRTHGIRNQSNSWSVAWSEFKKFLPHQQGEYAKRNWGHPRHSLCSYQGKMKPSLAAHLVRTFTTPGGRLLDPFSGVGTIPFEAALHGVECWGFDISPPAVHITDGKIGQCIATVCERTVGRLEDYLKTQGLQADERKSAELIRFNGVLASYFHERTFEEVLLARRFFLDNPPENASQSLVFACLLHILHGNRPYALSRRSHPITPFAPSGNAEYRALIPRLRDKVKRSLATPIPDDFVPGYSIFQDATAWWPAAVDNLDAIVTSPPFFDSTRFHLGNWMRLWFCGWEANDFRERPLAFVDERQKRSFEVYYPILRQCRERLKSDGVAVFHLGSSKKCDMAKELARIAKTWFRVADTYTECVAHCESHGIRDKGTVVGHQYLVLQ